MRFTNETSGPAQQIRIQSIDGAAGAGELPVMTEFAPLAGYPEWTPQAYDMEEHLAGSLSAAELAFSDSLRLYIEL